MYLKINKKKIEIFEYKKIIDRLKSLRFIFNEIDYGIKLPNKKTANTYFFCQRVDIIFTDKDDKILYLYDNIRSERIISKSKVKNIYYLPLNTIKDLEVGKKLNIKQK